MDAIIKYLDAFYAQCTASLSAFGAHADDVAPFADFVLLKIRNQDWTDEVLAPSPLVSTFWRAFILHTAQYVGFCTRFCIADDGTSRFLHMSHQVDRSDHYLATYLLLSPAQQSRASPFRVYWPRPVSRTWLPEPQWQPLDFGSPMPKNDENDQGAKPAQWQPIVFDGPWPKTIVFNVPKKVSIDVCDDEPPALNDAPNDDSPPNVPEMPDDVYTFDGSDDEDSVIEEWQREHMAVKAATVQAEESYPQELDDCVALLEQAMTEHDQGKIDAEIAIGLATYDESSSEASSSSDDVDDEAVPSESDDSDKDPDYVDDSDPDYVASPKRSRVGETPSMARKTRRLIMNV